MFSLLSSLTGYFAGIGVECAIIVIAAVLLALMLTGLLFKWMAAAAERRAARKAQREAERAEREARKEAERAEREIARLRAEEEARLAREEAERLAAEEAAMAELEETVEEPAEPEVVEQVETVIVKKKVVKVVEEVEEIEPEPQPEPEPEEEPAPEEEEPSDEEDADRGIVFADSKTITELYEELSGEQKSYFDELREEALTKPDAELAMSRNFVTVKIGKRNLIKLLIKRGVTVAEFMLENEALKQLRLSNRNKKGKNAIRVKPTVVQVLDLPSLKVAVDMINLAYEELMLSE